MWHDGDWLAMCPTDSMLRALRAMVARHVAEALAEPEQEPEPEPEP